MKCKLVFHEKKDVPKPKNRLTIRNSDGSVSQPYGVTVDQVFNRLAEFEDIGLAPVFLKALAEIHTVSEFCPHCNRTSEIVWDVKEDGYIAHCPYCGGEIKLCSECRQKESRCEPCEYIRETR